MPYRAKTNSNGLGGTNCEDLEVRFGNEGQVLRGSLIYDWVDRKSGKCCWNAYSDKDRTCYYPGARRKYYLPKTAESTRKKYRNKCPSNSDIFLRTRICV